MSRILSVFSDSLDIFGFNPKAEINGANLSVASLLRTFIADADIEAMEVFLPPDVMLHTDDLAKTAAEFLPHERRGKGALRFYPIHNLPDVWSDARPRVIYCSDTEHFPQQRYLRDRFAQAPTPIICDSHTLGHRRHWLAMERMAAAPPVAFDTLLCRSQSSETAMKRGFAWLRGDVEREVLENELPCRLDRLAYPVDIELFHPHDEEGKTDARRILGLPQNGTISLFFGRATAYSKADLLPLIEAFATATQATPQKANDYLLIVGTEYPKGYHDTLRELAAKLGISDRVILHGHTKTTLRPLYFAAADLFVFPGDSIIETSGITVLEAMASGLPCIVSDWDGLRDHVGEGETGFLVPTWWMPGTEVISAFSPITSATSDRLMLAQSVWVDTGVLQSRLSELLASATLRKTMGQAARSRVESSNATAVIHEKWRKLWSELEKLAAQETPHQTQERRDGADKLGVPIPYGPLFQQYASGVWPIDKLTLSLTTRGRAVAEGRESPGFYDETVPLLRPEILQILWREMSSDAAVKGLTVAALTQLCRPVTRADDALIRFHIGLCLKRGLFTSKIGRNIAADPVSSEFSSSGATSNPGSYRWRHSAGESIRKADLPGDTDT